jgi:hypothetical protein
VCSVLYSRSASLCITLSSNWQGYFKDKELTDLIDNDLRRTHPLNDFFLDRANQLVMRNVLFVWARLHPTLSYKQGMNELISPLMLTVAEDARRARKGCSAEDKQLSELLSAEHVEGDVYCMFARVMEMQHWLFLHKDPDYKPPVATPDNPLMQANASAVARDPPESPLLEKCKFVFHSLFKQVDLPLYEYLTTDAEVSARVCVCGVCGVGVLSGITYVRALILTACTTTIPLPDHAQYIPPALAAAHVHAGVPHSRHHGALGRNICECEAPTRCVQCSVV